MARAEAALRPSQDDRGLTAPGVERVQQRLFENLVSSSPPAPARSLRRSIVRWGVAFAAVCTAVLVWVPVQDKTNSEYTPRSGAERQLSSAHLLQVLRVQVRDSESVRVESAKRLSPGDHLRFAVVTRDRPAEVWLLMLRADGRPVVLGRQSLAPSPRTQQLRFSYDVSAELLGPVQFVAVFDHVGHVDPLAVKLDPRDDPDMSVRIVTVVVESSP